MATVKPDIGVVLADEAKVWAERLEKYRYEGNLLMAEQALGRQLEAEWLMRVYTGKVKYAPPKKANARSAGAKAKKPAAKKPAAKKAAPKKPAAKKSAPKAAVKTASAASPV